MAASPRASAQGAGAAAWPAKPVPPGRTVPAGWRHRCVRPSVVQGDVGAAGPAPPDRQPGRCRRQSRGRDRREVPADGYTFLVGATHHAIAPSIYPRLGYDLLKELTPVTVLCYLPNVVLVNPARTQVRTFAEFHKLVQANPGRLTFGSAGNGTAHHLVVELYKSLSRSFATHIPYRGAGPALQDLLAGQIDFMFDGLGSAMPYIKAGELLPLAVTSARRSFALPDVPTLAESGIEGYEAQLWYALWAPGGTPVDIVQRLQQETARALAGAELREIWQGLGAEPGGQAPAEMGAFVNAETQVGQGGQGFRREAGLMNRESMS
jgi:tripartite-type tricarboxylate transporter receptor subunit TctC